ncbi:hypothetical protein SD70_26035 [Gordoniibacillus kamchatkensis]|uniref:Copper amine oxidase-like N-terminal domain-containing protein n=1 Tax=Gordoniibacillus kamchatkensis TaxID=1590651 RepID=A0ABR5ACD3_9BACL|nr:stalk domain-containing protein [Paenibacillus sp. VKM B-2647]KIL38498.1 hypothetical protein SD70_26035 [Paenibacillus sp. VKM B-2647]
MLKKYRQLIVGILIGCFLMLGTSVFAEDGLQKIEAYLRPNLPITLNGSSIKLDNSPVMYNGNTYLRLRDLASLLPGLSINWNEQTQTVELVTYGDNAPAQSTTPLTTTTQQPTTDNNGSQSTQDMIFYNASDVYNKYPPMGKRFDDNGHIL